jgi:branched-chain amino acid transport system permease protein
LVLFGQFLEILIGGLLSGVLYSLVALGFVLIFKASGVFNFAQGAMVLLAGLALVRSLDLLVVKGFPFWTAVVLGLVFAGVIMAVTAWLVERFVLGPLVNQDGLTLFMSTIGATFVLEGASQMIFGSDVYPLRLFPTDAWFLFEGAFPGGILVNKLDVWGGLIAGVLVAGLAVFFQKTRIGRALRAVADSHKAALSVGISLEQIWVVVWFAAGLVALAAGIMWGARSNVSFALEIIALKALPVLILGGFTSIPGAIVGGLIVGAGEKLAEGFLGPHIGGGIEYWFAYVLALAVLLVRPQGLFGERIIERI